MTKSKLLALFLFAIFPLALFAADLTSTAAGLGALPIDSVLGWLTPVLTPILLMLVKKALPKLPAGIIPWLAPVVGAFIAFVDAAALNNSGSLIVGGILGALGVAAREMKEAILVFKAPNGGWPVPNP